MDIQVVKVNNDEKEILQKLLELYCYEWSQYNKLDVNQSGSYEFALLDCWTKENHYPFFIKVDGKLAGFVLVDKDFAVRKDYDFAMSEFFVMHKYRTSGVGRHAAKTIFNMFHGKWEVMCHPDNIKSIYFWKKIIDECTNGKFEFMESCQEAAYQDGTLADLFFFES
jgi:predicted acetyltransferase